jgi:hypothetical protein
MVDHYAPLLDHFDESLDDLEATVLRDPSPDQLQTLLGLKRQIISFRKTLVYQREVLARLSRGEFAQIDRREMVFYRNVYDHLIRFAELIDSSREMVSDLMQTHLAAPQRDHEGADDDLDHRPADDAHRGHLRHELSVHARAVVGVRLSSRHWPHADVRHRLVALFPLEEMDLRSSRERANGRRDIQAG